MSLLSEGQTIGGTYTVETFLGEGAFAEVYRVRHRFLRIRQAMKVFKIVNMTADETVRLLDEAVLLSRMDHPNIVRVFDADVTDTSAGVCGYFTMEYVAGGSLDRFWRSHGSQLVPLETSVDVMRQVARGLSVAHSEQPPIVHRDIKPQNILVGYDPTGLRARVSDFGLAKHVNPLTLRASARGTRAFKAPEAFRDFQDDSLAGDVWALGTTLYLLLTDRFPYAEVMADLLDERRFGRVYVPPSQFNPQVDPALDAIVERALALRREQRYQTAMELLAALERWRPSPPEGKLDESLLESTSSKDALGPRSSSNEALAREMAERALKLARQADRLGEAADLMEEAFNKWPGLRELHERRVQRWRCGIVM